MAHTLDMVIRGGGIVGKSLALLLARERFRVGLVEARATKADSEPDVENATAADVRSFALNTASKHLLESLACWPTGLAVTPIERMRVFGDGNSVVNFSASALAWMVDASALEQVLQQAVGFQPQIQLNTTEQARLTVVCEGSHSSTRERWCVPYQRHLYA
ncbi:MAG: ubiquinone biosynthesis protein UbiH, partial [Betaproteobacteria bacterium]|nr:ubiquinone biosynthesis protein UbiH [Betaproteobacteria bacterium]